MVQIPAPHFLKGLWFKSQPTILETIYKGPQQTRAGAGKVEGVMGGGRGNASEDVCAKMSPSLFS